MTYFKINKQNPSQPLEICLLSNNVYDYHVISQGKTTIPSVDDGEEMGLTDVRNRKIYFHELTLFRLLTKILKPQKQDFFFTLKHSFLRAFVQLKSRRKAHRFNFLFFEIKTF